jgi:hypothetical protein
MPSPLQWKSIDLYQYMAIWLSPIQWISKEQQFTVVPFSDWRLLPWYFIWIFGMFAYGTLGSFCIPIRELIVVSSSDGNRVSLVQNLTLFGLGMIAGFCWCINWSVVAIGMRSVRVVNRLIVFYKDLTHGMMMMMFLNKLDI